MKRLLPEAKKRYETLQKKYNLPSFNELNKEFEIEKVQETETDFLLREVRKSVGEKIGAFLRFLENIINPTLASIFVLNSLKDLDAKDKETIKNSYEILVRLELEAIHLDIDYDEKKEAAFILKAYKKWQEIKPDMNEIVKLMERTQKKIEERKNSYLG